MSTNKKRIGRRADQIQNGWEEGAPDAKFRKKSLDDLKTIRDEITAAERESEDLAVQKKLVDTRINDLYERLDAFIVDVGEGVRGHDDYGTDSPLYGAMGFVRKSERRSGLTRKKKNRNGAKNK